MRKGFPIEIYMEGLPHESYFIALMLQGQLMVGPTKKLVTSHVIGDLALLN